MTNPSKCAVCGVSASLKCMACKQVYYCGKDHQKIHWKKGHKAECKCYEVNCYKLFLKTVSNIQVLLNTFEKIFF